MKNLSKIQRVSKKLYLLFSVLLVVTPLCYVFFWIFINQIPESLITVNMPAKPLVKNYLSLQLRLWGFLASLLPLSAQMYGLLNLKRLFAYYKEGVIFTYAHVECFRNIGKALLLWVVFGLVYKTASTLLFSLGNPPGQRILEIGFSSTDFTALLIGSIIMVISWVMDEGRELHEDQALTV